MTVTKRMALLTCLLAFLAMWSGPLPAEDGQNPTPALTYDKVLEYVRLEIKEEKMLRMIRESVTQFTLGKDQISELKNAGASERLIEALQKKGDAISAGSDIRNFVVILDCSGSMKDQAAGGTTKWDAAQKAALDLVESVPEGRGLSFIVYGHDVERKCQAVDVVRPLSPLDSAGKKELQRHIKELEPAGHTPIALSLQKAGLELAKSKDLTKLVLITDGMETCHGDSIKAAADLLAKHPHLRGGGVDVIGLGLIAEESEAVAQIAKSGQGKYYDARNVRELNESVRIIKEQVEEKIDVAESKIPASKNKPSTEVAAPTPLELGKYVSGRLGDSNKTGKCHYWLVDVPAGKYTVVLDVERVDGESNWMGGSLYWVSPEGKEGNNLGRIKESDHRHRGVFQIHCDKPMKQILAYWNYETLSDYQLGLFPEKDAFDTPFFLMCPAVEKIKVEDNVSARGLTSKAYQQRDGYYRLQLPQGIYRVKAEFQSMDSNARSMGGGIYLLNENGHTVNKLISTKHSPKCQESVKLVVHDDITVFVRVWGREALVNVNFTFQEWKNE